MIKEWIAHASEQLKWRDGLDIEIEEHIKEMIAFMEQLDEVKKWYQD